VLADSAEGALAALGDRVPDLILTSALLSPNDEVVLGERLRALDAAASHVQTLTIPVLAAPRTRVRERAGGVLSALRREKPRDTAPDGCDPAVFAEQIASYLERAAQERPSAVRRGEAGRGRCGDPIVEESIVEGLPPTDRRGMVCSGAGRRGDVHSESCRPGHRSRRRPLERGPHGAGSRLPVRRRGDPHGVAGIASLSQMFEDQVEESHQGRSRRSGGSAGRTELPAGMIELDLSTILEDAADRSPRSGRTRGLRPRDADRNRRQDG
jgi:hypothetical protein